jgi:exodeoxyribonuclease V alpha subunit
VTVVEQLAEAVAAGALRELDLYFGRWMLALADRPGDALLLGACLASQRVGAGDVCLDLRASAGGEVLAEGGAPIRAPGLAEWREALLGSGVVAPPQGRAPLVLDGHDRLYLARYFRLEQELGAALLARARRAPAPVDRQRLREGLARLFPPADLEPDEQRVAAALAVLRGLAVLSGGPGTGKTRTVTAILALLAGQAGPAPARVALAAPTGKAAARLAESVRRAREALPLTAGERAAIPEEAVTLHRLLGARPGRVDLRYHQGHPLPVDVLVVDEASMVDLALMSRLLAALPEAARLVLLGDRDQLASVEAGAVLGDVCGHGRPLGWSTGLAEALAEVTGGPVPAAAARAGEPLADSIVLLRRSYRFGRDSGVGRLARAVNAGDAGAALDLLGSEAVPEVRLRTVAAGAREALVAEALVPWARAVLAAGGPGEALARLGRLRVLAAVREGPWGVVELNRLIERALVREGLAGGGPRRAGAVPGAYPGQPVLLTRNDYALGLWNGDVGVLWSDPQAGGALQAWFQRPGGGLRRVPPARLPGPQTVYAMTVHKSQGSEFDRVVLVLPERPAPVLTRELLYTAITRARAGVEIWASPAVLAAAIRARVERSSGLRDALWPGPP